jgi:hypothetical protein
MKKYLVVGMFLILVGFLFREIFQETNMEEFRM